MRSDEEERLARTVVVRNVYSSILQRKVNSYLQSNIAAGPSFFWSPVSRNARVWRNPLADVVYSSPAVIDAFATAVTGCPRP